MFQLFLLKNICCLPQRTFRRTVHSKSLLMHHIIHLLCQNPTVFQEMNSLISLGGERHYINNSADECCICYQLLETEHNLVRATRRLMFLNHLVQNGTIPNSLNTEKNKNIVYCHCICLSTIFSVRNWQKWFTQISSQFNIQGVISYGHNVTLTKAMNVRVTCLNTTIWDAVCFIPSGWKIQEWLQRDLGMKSQHKNWVQYNFETEGWAKGKASQGYTTHNGLTVHNLYLLLL